MPRSLIALGSNLGDRAQTLRRAVELIAADDSVWGLAASGFHQTRPAGGPSNQSDYLNAAVALDTSMSPEKLHDLLRRIETRLGRRPGPRWSARAIDLDLLLFGEAIIESPTLLVPHPRMAFRRFVLAPSAEVGGEMIHPLIDWSVSRLLAHLDTAAPYVALLGMPDENLSALARRVAGAIDGTYLACGNDVALADWRADPSGLAEQQQIQFLDRAASLLATRDWNGLAISDFFFDEPLAYARVGQDQVACRRIREAWAARRRAVVGPKLLVVLDSWVEGLRARAGAGQLPPDAQPGDRLRRELLQLAGRSDQGPVLYAGRGDPQVQFDEITAAIAAME